MDNTYDIPVAMIVYKRPDLTKKVFEKIREVHPEKLYIISDGPKNAEEALKVNEVRDYLEHAVDWECEVHKNYAEKNMGIRYRMPSGMEWIFGTEDRAVFIEDDVMPTKEFFRFCREMLIKYENDPDVAMISGTNFAPEDKSFGEYDICFSYFSSIWGWATWKRVFEGFDINMKSWPEVRKKGAIRDIFSSKGYGFYKWMFDDLQFQWYRSWAYIWAYHRYVKHMRGIVPKYNLVGNAGMNDADAEHPGDTESRVEYIENLKKGTFGEKILCPSSTKANREYDRMYQDRHLPKAPGLFMRIKYMIRTPANRRAYLTICEMEKDTDYMEKVLSADKKLSPEESKLNGGALYRQLSGKEMRKDASEYRKYRKEHR